MERILCGDALDQLRILEAESVHTCVTSPPYYNLSGTLSGKWAVWPNMPLPWVRPIPPGFRKSWRPEKGLLIRWARN